MTLIELEMQFGAAPMRELGKAKVRGYFLNEIKQIGVTKGQLKKLVKQKILEQLCFKSDYGTMSNFYKLIE